MPVLPTEQDNSMAKTNTLSQKGIVITRPSKQAESLARNIKKAGGCPFVFPLIEITPLDDEQTSKKLETIKDYDIVIFISINAVEQCIQLLGSEALKTKTLVSTGKRTANALAKHDLKVKYCPDKYFNSEALLAIEAFAEESKSKKIAIIRGASGRDYLKNGLIDLGASVDYIDVYKRHCPQKNLHELKSLWQNRKLSIVLLTSASSTASFFALANNEIWINEITILIGSSRMQHEIPERFKGKILVAEDPSDDTLLKKLTVELT